MTSSSPSKMKTKVKKHKRRVQHFELDVGDTTTAKGDFDVKGKRVSASARSKGKDVTIHIKTKLVDSVISHLKEYGIDGIQVGNKQIDLDVSESQATLKVHH